MADSAERQLRILLRLAADTAGAQAIKAELKSVEAQAASTNAAVTASSSAGAAATQQRATFTGVLAAEEAKVSSQLTQQTAIESQLQVIAATRFELAQALANTDRAQADLLRGELGIRQATLGVMRAETLTQAELNKLSASEEVLLGKLAQNAAATAAGGVLAGASLNKAKGEAIVLARELATGSLNARTMGAFLGSFGNTLTIAGIAGYGLFQIFSHIYDEEIAYNKELDKTLDNIVDQTKHWQQLARDAKDAKDISGLTKAIIPELNTLAQKLKELRENDITGWHWWSDQIAGVIAATGVATAPWTTNKQQQDERLKQLQLLEDQTLRMAHSDIELARQSAAEWDRVKVLPVAEAISIYSNKLDDLRFKQSQLDTTTRGGIKDYDDLGRSISETEEKLKILQGRTREISQFETARLSELRQQQQLINANPNLGVDARNEQLHNLYLKERTTLLSEIIKLTALIKQLEESGSDEKLIGPIRKELQDINVEVGKLTFKLQETGTFSDQLGVSLMGWVNGFGTAAQQVSGLIEGSINASLQGTNQLLLDAAFRTGNWQQTLVGVERQIGNLFLTFIEKQIEQFVLGEAHKAASTATSVAQGHSIAGSHAAGAAAVSIESGGAAAILGGIAAVAAIAAIIAALSGGFKKGGFTGHGDPDEYAGPAHKGEFLFPARATRNIGVDNLYAMMHAAENAPHFVDGGRVRYPGLFPGNDIEPPWLPGADLPNDFFDPALPVAPRLVAVDPYGLPIAPGGMDDEPIIGLGPNRGAGPTVQVNWRGTGGAPYWNYPVAGGPSPMPWWMTFNPNIGNTLFTSLNDLGFGRTPGGVVSPGYTGAMPPWLQDIPTAEYSPTYTPPSPDRSSPLFIDPATGMTFTQLDDGTYVPVSRGGTPTSGGGPVAAPIGTHWDFTRGTYVQNDFAGGPQFNTHAAALLEMWEQSLAGKPNTLTHGNTDFGHNTYTAGTFHRLTDADMWDAAIGSAWHGADGLRLPGAPSRTDTMLGWLAAGERVIPAHRNVLLEKTFGFDWDKRLEVAMPHFATGGRLGAASSASSVPRSSRPTKVIVIADARAAAREAQRDPGYEVQIVDIMNRNRHEIGLPAVQ